MGDLRAVLADNDELLAAANGRMLGTSLTSNSPPSPPPTSRWWRRWSDSAGRPLVMVYTVTVVCLTQDVLRERLRDDRHYDFGDDEVVDAIVRAILGGER